MSANVTKQADKAVSLHYNFSRPSAEVWASRRAQRAQRGHAQEGEMTKQRRIATLHGHSFFVYKSWRQGFPDPII